VAAVLLCLQVVAAFVYYGLVMLVPQLEFVAGESKQCLNGHLTVPVSRTCACTMLRSGVRHTTCAAVELDPWQHMTSTCPFSGRHILCSQSDALKCFCNVCQPF
jgi:hypothetical protein